MIKNILEESKEMQKEMNRIMYARAKQNNSKGRSELVKDIDLENKMMKMGANSAKEAKKFLEQELMEAHPDRYIDTKKENSLLFDM